MFELIQESFNLNEMIPIYKANDLRECSEKRKCLSDLDLAIKSKILNHHEYAYFFFQRSLLNNMDYFNYNQIKYLLKNDPLLDYFKPLVFFNCPQISIKITYLIKVYM